MFYVLTSYLLKFYLTERAKSYIFLLFLELGVVRVHLNLNCASEIIRLKLVNIRFSLFND